MNKEEAQKIWNCAKYIFSQSRLNDVRRNARDIALGVEKYFTNEKESASYWRVD